MFLWNRNLLGETAVGEIVVYNVKGKDIPIVHRVVRKFGVGWVSSFLALELELGLAEGIAEGKLAN